MARVSLAEIKKHTGAIDAQLNNEVSTDHLNRISEDIDNWPKYADVLNLKGHQRADIETTPGLTYLMRIQRMLRDWKDNESFGATYLKLTKAALSVGDSTIAIKVCRLSKECRVDESPDKFPSFTSWLQLKGVSDRDLQVLESDGFSSVQSFKLLKEEDFKDMNLTKAGKRLIPQLLEEVSKGAGLASQAPPPSSGASPPTTGPGTSEVSSSSDSRMLNRANNEINYFDGDCANAYNTMVKCSVKLNYAMSRDPKSLALSLYGAGFISQSTLDETVELNETKNSKGSRLYSAVLGRVRNFPKKFADFIEILRKDRALYGDVLAEIDKVYHDIQY